jgi:hypothetical protein
MELGTGEQEWVKHRKTNDTLEWIGKTYVLNFNKEDPFDEEDKIDAISRATDSWGNNFSTTIKNVKENTLDVRILWQNNLHLFKDELQVIDWKRWKV